MTVEIERKFLVVGDGWRSSVTESRSIRQAYIAKNDRLSIRIRIDDNAVSTLTIKTAASGIARDEYEYQIPGADAEELMHQREGAVVSKVRYIVPVGGLIWEIDEFEEENSGLVIAEKP